MDNFMNEPAAGDWNNMDIVNEYKVYKDIKAIQARYLLSKKEVTDILRQEGALCE